MEGNMLGSLINFDKFVAPTLIKIVYWLGIIGIIGYVLVQIANAFQRLQFDASGALGAIIIALLTGAIGLLVWRVTCEIWIVLFSINDRLGQLVDRGKV
jgi:membrane protein DedA with SNARE-associated domain